MHKVFFGETTVEAQDGSNLLEVLIAGGLFLHTSCGGEGVCGECKVKVEKGVVESEPSPLVSPAEKEERIVLSCQARIKSDLVVRLIGETRLEKGILKESLLLQDESLIQKAKPSPLIKKEFLTLTPPTHQDNIDDLSRIRRGLKKDYKISLSALKSLASSLRDGDFRVTLSIKDDEVIKVEAGERREQYAVALDIGTTSVYGRLLDLKDQRVLAEASDYNKQMVFGADIISRIVYSEQRGIKPLQEKIAETVNGILDRLGADNLSYLTASGNTTMIHLLLGIDPKNIRRTPYVPAFSQSLCVDAESVGINIEAPLFTLPSVSSYIGGDIAAGILACGIAESDELTLYIDLGTNGEVVLGNSEFLVACSASCGPAFEGGGIGCGMRATDGAIKQITIDPDTKRPFFVTIGRKKPAGICGAGLIDLLYQLLASGIIDQRAKFTENKEYRLTEDIAVTEADLDNLLRAKSAIFAGISILLKEVGITEEELDRIIIAGNLGGHIEPKKAISIGLFPEIEIEKFSFIGNGSLIGAQLFAYSERAKERAEEIANSITTIELSDNQSYYDEYIAGLFLPHTDKTRFPQAWREIERTDGDRV